MVRGREQRALLVKLCQNIIFYLFRITFDIALEIETSQNDPLLGITVNKSSFS